MRNVILRADFAYLREEFEGIRRTDDGFRIRAGAEYSINKFLSLTLGYRFRLRETNAVERDFRRNIVVLGLEAQL